MAQSKEFFTRIQHKHDIEANWIKAVNFIPLAGEIIVYDKDEGHDYTRIKIGDGVTTVINLEFVADINDLGAITIDIEGATEGTPATIDADTFNGYTIDNFVMYNTDDGESDYMAKAIYDTDGDGVVDNAAKLGGKTSGQLTFGADQIITDESTDKRLPETLEEKMPKSEGNALIGGTDIPANSDLNSYTQPGNYCCYANAAAVTLVNCPASSAFILRVFASSVMGTWQYRWQELMPIEGSQNYSYLRRCGSSDGGITWNWDEWQTPMPKSGGTFTGNVYMHAGNRQGGNAVRGIWVGNSNWKSVSTDEIQMIRK